MCRRCSACLFARVEALAWLGSGVICGCVFLMLPSLFNSIDQGTLTWFVIGALGGAIVGQFRSLPITFFASLVIGVIQSTSDPVRRQPPVHARLPKHDAVRGVGRRDHVDQPQAHCRAVRQGDAMTTVATSAPVAATRRRTRPCLARDVADRWFEPVAVVVVLFLGLFAIPAFFDSFWVANFTQMAVFSDRRRQRRPAVRARRPGVARSGRVIRHRLLGDHSSVVRHVVAVSDRC